MDYFNDLRNRRRGTGFTNSPYSNRFGMSPNRERSYQLGNWQSNQNPNLYDIYNYNQSLMDPNYQPTWGTNTNQDMPSMPTKSGPTNTPILNDIFAAQQNPEQIYNKPRTPESYIAPDPNQIPDIYSYSSLSTPSTAYYDYMQNNNGRDALQRNIKSSNAPYLSQIKNPDYQWNSDMSPSQNQNRMQGRTFDPQGREYVIDNFGQGGNNDGRMYTEGDQSFGGGGSSSQYGNSPLSGPDELWKKRFGRGGMGSLGTQTLGAPSIPGWGGGSGGGGGGGGGSPPGGAR